VSLDGGARWQPLTLNLPGVQVRDLAIDTREGELVAATHGRAFWILDDITLLEQLARQSAFTTASLQLFTPETAWLSNAYGGPAFFTIPNFGQNPDYGAAIFFNLPAGYTGQTPVTLTLLDARGASVRSFTLHSGKQRERKLTPAQEENLDATQQRERDLRKNTGATTGMNRFLWDLKYSPAYDVPGFRSVPTDDWPDTSDGPTVVPGTYTVVLQYGSQRLQSSVEVRLDPRIHPAAGDLEARLALEMRLLSAMDSLDRAIAAALSARNRASATQRSAIDDEVNRLIMLDVHSSEADVVKPTKIREQLAFLMNSLEGAYTRPTAAEYAAAKELEDLAAAGEARLQALASH
jgi:hypothetical protein